MIYFLTFGNDKYNESKRRISKEASSLGIFNKIIIKSPVDLPYELPFMTKKVLSLPRGAGYWIWKPIIIKEQLESMNNEDILIYADAGCYLNIYGIDRLHEYISYLTMNKPLIRFYMDFAPEYKYTTSSIFKYFNVENDDNITKTGQYIGGIQIIKKNDISMKIINEWYNVAIEKPLLFTDFHNNIERHNEFIDNRHDQSIFSIITKININNIHTIIDETNTYNEKYPIFAARIRK
jgi:hypothetical protein